MVTSEVGKSAGGKVIENILKGLIGEGHELLAICAENNLKNASSANIIKVPYRYVFHQRIDKISTILFHVSLRHRYWQYFVIRHYKKVIREFKPQLIYPIGSGGSIAVLNLGMGIAKSLRVPFAIHLLDPIPAQKGWETYENYRKSRVHTIKNALKYADLIIMGNPQMLEFQQSNLNFDILSKSMVVPDPVVANPIKLDSLPANNKLTFLGSFYGARKPDSLLLGFSKYIEKDSNAILQIVGLNNIQLNNFSISEKAKQQIVFQKWTSDLKMVFEQAKVLIDVDADIDGDVFISSKLKEYLTLDRVILSITRQNSPARKMLTGLTKSIVFSGHNPIEVAEAIEKALNAGSDISIFKERKTLLTYLSIERIASELSTNFERIINKKSLLSD